MTNYEKITKTTAALADLLLSMNARKRPWDAALETAFCLHCCAEDCITEECLCPALREDRALVSWWLQQEAET
jgi:hypothetical protein